MKRTLLACLILLFYNSIFAQTPWRLEKWLEVDGELAGLDSNTELGKFVTGIKPTANFPFRAAVSRNGRTQLFTLQSKTDTSAKMILPGENLLTGDLNGDGNTDVVTRIGSYNDTVAIYWGTSTGIDTVHPTKLRWKQHLDDFGFGMYIGNIIGDSTPDLVISAPSSDYSGKVYIYRGGASFDTVPALVLKGDSAYHQYGVNCAIGDLNNDGFNDLIIKGNFQYWPTNDLWNYIDIWWGGTSLDSLQRTRIRSAYFNSDGLACFDVNGDGIADLLWTVKDSLDWVYVHYGGKNFDTIPSLRLKDPGFAEYGTSIVNAGDMNGDGYDDILVAAPYSQVTGYVYVYSGGPKMDGTLDAYASLAHDSYFGGSIAGIGDVNGDGLADIIVGAPRYPFYEKRGYWAIFLGSKNIKVTSVPEQADPPRSFELNQNYPNPFNSTTIISYRLEGRSRVQIVISNSAGQTVSTINKGEEESGDHQIRFDASHLSSGTYFYEISVTPLNTKHTITQTKVMTLIK